MDRTARIWKGPAVCSRIRRRCTVLGGREQEKEWQEVICRRGDAPGPTAPESQLGALDIIPRAMDSHGRLLSQRVTRLGDLAAAGRVGWKGVSH